MVRNYRTIPQEVEDAFFAHVFTGLIIPHTSSQPKVVVNINGGWIRDPVRRLAATKGGPGPVLVHDNQRKVARDLAKLASIGTARVEDVSAASRRTWTGWLAILDDGERGKAESTLEAERAIAVATLPSGGGLAPAVQPRAAPVPTPRAAPPPAPRSASKTQSARSSTTPASQTPAAETPEPEAGPSGLNRTAQDADFHDFPGHEVGIYSCS
ncbi:hypothetical protein BCR35DRAFT_298252 [Leucosporidium creatinivorum]|uniref:Uncharacterized protein n=1 Tax=Leucosporidium creatinivorum TaxID=106004 RepID=A0A1Y2G475_9BASI|nr:hypothetical protein BCR35DRAFT_298252 [Leucosporidium creatinivorum]